MIFHDKDFSKISGDPCWLFIFKEKRCGLNFKEMWLVYLIAWWCFLDIFICGALISQSRILWFQYSRRQEVQPVHPKGDQSWVFIGRTDGKTETPILWPPHAKSWLIEKTLMLGGIGGRRRRGNRGWDGWVASPTRWTWVSVNSGSWWWTWRPGVLRFMGHKESDTTEWLIWTELILALRSPWTVWSGKKIGHWEMNSPAQSVPNMLLEISGEITPGRMKRWSQSKNNTQLWMWLVIEIKYDAVKSNISREPGMLGSWIKANCKWSNRSWQDGTSTM